MAGTAPAETVLAFDFGAKRIGVAVGNNFLRQAQALKTIHAESTAARHAQIAALLGEWQPQRLVVGIPVSVDGTPHLMTRQCERFANQLHGRYGLPVERVDERYSSQQADHLQQQRRSAGAARAAATDHLAAQVILQSYFDSLPQSQPQLQPQLQQSLPHQHVA